MLQACFFTFAVSNRSSLNYVGGVATEINAVSYVYPRSWLATTHFVLGFFSSICELFMACGRAHADAARFETLF